MFSPYSQSTIRYFWTFSTSYGMIVALLKGGYKVFYLLNVDESEKNFRLYYEFEQQNHRESNGIVPILLENGVLSDYETFKVSHQLKKDNAYFPSVLYLFGVGTVIVGTVYVMEVGEHIADISCDILPKYQKKGYGSLAIRETEKLLFQDPNIFFTRISDLKRFTHHDAASKIAVSLGYEALDTFYVKKNPNYTLEEIDQKIIHLK